MPRTQAAERQSRLGLQYVFPAARVYVERETASAGVTICHETAIQRAFAAAVRSSGMSSAPLAIRFATLSRPTCWRMALTFERSGAIGHTSLQTTMIYTHVLNRGGLGVQSPADKL